MLQIYLKVLLIMAVFIAFAIPGFVMKKLKMIGDGGILTLSNLLLYVCQPALAIKAFCIFDEEAWASVCAVDKVTLLKNFGITLAVSVLAIGLTFALCKLVLIKAKDKTSANIYSFIAVFSNCGFFGIPFVEMFTDGNPLAVMYIMVFNVVFNLSVWTLGVYLITGNFKEIKLKKLVCNPAIISNFVALLLFFVPQINVFMMEEVKELRVFPQYLANMTAPLSMVIVGVRLAETPVKKLFCTKGVYLAGGLRLIVAPFLTLLVTLPFWGLVREGSGNFSEYVYIAPIIAMTMSPAASVVAMAERFLSRGNAPCADCAPALLNVSDPKETAVCAFVTNTLLSVITIPLVITAVMAICGVSV